MKFNKRFKDTWNFLIQSKRYIYFVIFAFFISALIGFIFKEDLGFLKEILRKLIADTQGMTGVSIIVYIFFNNFKACLFSMIGGLILGLFPLFNAISNGVILGYVFGLTYEKSGISDFWRIFPHGIFELPAVFISLGLGIRLGMFLFSKEPRKAFVNDCRKTLWAFFLIIMPLLIIAAIIEGLLITYLK